MYDAKLKSKLCVTPDGHVKCRAVEARISGQDSDDAEAAQRNTPSRG